MTVTLDSIGRDAAVRAATPVVAQRLTRRASLNAAAALLDYAVRIGTMLAITPLLVRGLGPALFGTWEMLVRLGSYVSATDGRPTEALRLLVARAHGAPHARDIPRLVGASLIVWGLLAPLVALVGGLVVLAAPQLVSAAPETADAVRIATALLVLALLAGSLAAVPESVLRGLNLGHTRIGAQVALHVISAALCAAAVWAGLGLAGLAGATLLRALLTGLSFWAIVVRRVPDFGVTRPARGMVRDMLGMSVWLTAGDIIAKLVLASDVLVLGMIIAPVAVTPYVLTGQAARVAVGLHVFTAGEAMPGIGALLGAGEASRARNARRDLLVLTWLCSTVTATTLLAWNPGFVGLWVGPAHHAGGLVDLLIVLTAMQTAFIRLDSGIIDAALRPRERVIAGAVTAIVTLALSIIGTKVAGVAGLCLAVLVGRTLQTVAYPWLVTREFRRAAIGAAPGIGVGVVLRAIAVTVSLLALGSWIGANAPVDGWLPLIAGALLTSGLALGVCVLFGTPAGARAMLRARLHQLLDRGGAR